jgi:hypothetical protein
MTNVVIAALATACVLTAVEGLIISIGKWRGLLASAIAVPSSIILGVSGLPLLIYCFASTFLGLTMSLLVEQVFTGSSVREMRGLPKRVDRI